jgi:hypothetical protein
MSEPLDHGEALIFPIGHFLGAHVPTGAAVPDFHVVRIGWDVYKLTGDEQLAVWALAHGLPDPDGNERSPWTRASLHGAARVAGIPNVNETLAELLEQDLVIEVRPNTPEAVEFAKVCRTRSLLVGLGNSVEEPLLYGVGATEQSPAVRVPGFAYELWRWGHACDSLWHACHVFAAAGDPADPEHTDPERILARCLDALQVLVANGAAYLDEAREEVPQPVG